MHLVSPKKKRDMLFIRPREKTLKGKSSEKRTLPDKGELPTSMGSVMT